MNVLQPFVVLMRGRAERCRIIRRVFPMTCETRCESRWRGANFQPGAASSCRADPGQTDGVAGPVADSAMATMAARRHSGSVRSLRCSLVAFPSVRLPCCSAGALLDV
jgi:hypothetical protein